MKLFSTGYIERNENKKPCGIDLDDVLAVSIPSWIKFVNNFDYLSEEFVEIVGQGAAGNIAKYAAWARRDHCHLVQMKKEIPYYYYRILKELYRESDVKKNLPSYHSASLFSGFLQNLGYFIVILTARNERSLKITVDWLKNNYIHYDAIIFDENKHVRMIESYPKTEFIVEDHRGIANLLAGWGYEVYLIDNVYNSGKIHNNVKRIMGSPRHLEELMKRIEIDEEDRS